MENTPKPDPGEKQTKGFKLFAAQRIVTGAIAIVLLLWLVHYGLYGRMRKPLRKAPFRPISVSCSNFNPRNTNQYSCG